MEFIISRIICKHSLPHHSITLLWFPRQQHLRGKTGAYLSYRSAVVYIAPQTMSLLQGLWRSYMNCGNYNFMLLWVWIVLASPYSCGCMYWWSLLLPLYPSHNFILHPSLCFFFLLITLPWEISNCFFPFFFFSFDVFFILSPFNLVYCQFFIGLSLQGALLCKKKKNTAG